MSIGNYNFYSFSYIYIVVVLFLLDKIFTRLFDMLRMVISLPRIIRVRGFYHQKALDSEARTRFSHC